MVRKLIQWLFAVPLVLLGPAALAQGGGQDKPPADFRPYVFGAYTVAFVLLFVFVAIMYLRQKSLDSDVDALKERVEKKR